MIYTQNIMSEVQEKKKRDGGQVKEAKHRIKFTKEDNAKKIEIKDEAQLLEVLKGLKSKFETEKTKADSESDWLSLYISNMYAALVCIDSYEKYDMAQGRNDIYIPLLKKVQEVITNFEDNMKSVEAKGMGTEKKLEKALDNLKLVKERIIKRTEEESGGINSWYNLIGILAHPFEGLFFNLHDNNKGRLVALKSGLGEIEGVISRLEESIEKGKTKIPETAKINPTITSSSEVKRIDEDKTKNPGAKKVNEEGKMTEAKEQKNDFDKYLAQLGLDPKDFESYRTDILKEMGKSCRNTLEHSKQTGAITKEAVLTWGIEKVKARFNLNYVKSNSKLKFDLESKNPKNLSGDDLDRWVQEEIGKLLGNFYSDRNIKVGDENDRSLRELFHFEKNLDEVFGEDDENKVSKTNTEQVAPEKIELGPEKSEDRESIKDIIHTAYTFKMGYSRDLLYKYQTLDNFVWSELKKLGIIVERQSAKELSRKVVIEGEEFTDVNKVVEKILIEAEKKAKNQKNENGLKQKDKLAKRVFEGEFKRLKHKVVSGVVDIYKNAPWVNSKDFNHPMHEVIKENQISYDVAEEYKKIFKTEVVDKEKWEEIYNQVMTELQKISDASIPQQGLGVGEESGYTEDMNQQTNSNLPPARDTRNRAPKTNTLPRGQQPLIKKFGKDAIKYSGARELEYVGDGVYKDKAVEGNATSDAEQVTVKTGEAKSAKKAIERIVNDLDKNFDLILSEVKKQNIEKSEEKVLEFVTDYLKKNFSVGFKFKEPVIWKGEEVKDFSDVVKKIAKDILVQMEDKKSDTESAAILTHPDQLKGQDYIVNAGAKKIEGGAREDGIVKEDGNGSNSRENYFASIGELEEPVIPKEDRKVLGVDAAERERLIQIKIKELEGGFFKKLFTGNWTVFKSEDSKKKVADELRKVAEISVDEGLRKKGQGEALVGTTESGLVDTASTEETKNAGTGVTNEAVAKKIADAEKRIKEINEELKQLSKQKIRPLFSIIRGGRELPTGSELIAKQDGLILDKKRQQRIIKTAKAESLREQIRDSRENGVDDIFDKNIKDAKEAIKGKDGIEYIEARQAYEKALAKKQIEEKRKRKERLENAKQLPGPEKYIRIFGEKMRDKDVWKNIGYKAGIITAGIGIGAVMMPLLAPAFAAAAAAGSVGAVGAMATAGAVKGVLVENIQQTVDKRRGLTTGSEEEKKRNEWRKKRAAVIGAISLGGASLYANELADAATWIKDHIFTTGVKATKPSGFVGPYGPKFTPGPDFADNGNVKFRLINGPDAGQTRFVGSGYTPDTPTGYSPVQNPIETSFEISNVTNTEDLFRSAFTNLEGFNSLSENQKLEFIRNLEANLMESRPAVIEKLMDAFNIPRNSPQWNAILENGSFRGLELDQIVKGGRFDVAKFENLGEMVFRPNGKITFIEKAFEAARKIKN